MLRHASREPAANDGYDDIVCSLPRKVLRCDAGCEFRQVAADAVMLMQHGRPGPVLKCGCNTQGCGVRVDPTDPQTILALEDVCHGNWGWTLRVPGIAQAFIVLATQPDSVLRE